MGRVLEAFWRHPTGDNSMSFGDARKDLELAGLGLIQDDQLAGPRSAAKCWLAIPNQAPLVAQLFAGTKWGGEPGTGVWASALRQGPRGELWDTRSWRINGVTSRCTVIRIAALYNDDGIMQANPDRVVDSSNPDLS